MVALRRLFDFYLYSSFHVALSVYCLIRITESILRLGHNPYVAGFGFFGTVTGYNFVKYDALARSGKPALSRRLMIVLAISFLCFAAAVLCFLKLALVTQITSAIFVAVTALYTLPFFPNRKSARSWAGLKIYIVALCWVGVTVVLPVLNAGAALDADFYLVCLKRFLFIVVLLFVFEIIDLAWDDPHLKTVPQQIGVWRTKKLGILLLAFFLLLELFLRYESRFHFIASLITIAVTATFLLFANERRGRYYTVFWTESIPVLWWLMILIIRHW